VRDLILGLARPLMRLLRRDERGAVGVLVALLIGGGVLTGMGAMVIDVGQLYQERAELQNGADAAALAVAKSCVTSTCSSSIAAQYANENASALTGGKAGVSQVCGSGTLGTCPASSGAMTDCPSAPSSGYLGYVDVHTSTKLANGSTLLPPVFAETLLGNGSFQGTNVQACAQVAWGGPTSGNTLAFTISACSWNADTSSGTNYAPAPPAVPAASYDIQLNLSSLGNSAGCSGEPSGSDGAGAFGWTQDQTGSCGVDTTTTTIPAATGASAGSTCKTALANAYASRATPSLR
jgi:Flp pilus assembly protein TadG